MRRASLSAASLLGLAVTFYASSAFCQSDEDRAGARAAAMAGAKSMDEGKWQEAIDLFLRAEQLVHAPPHLLYIARANVKLGRLVRARESYLKILKDEIPATAPKAFRDARANATEEIATLESRLATVKVTITGQGAENAVVWMDGQKLAAAMSGVPVPVDPGAHSFLARTRELESAPTPFTVTEGSKSAVTLDLRIPIKISEAPAGGGIDPADVSPPSQEGAKSHSGLRTAAIVSFGAAGVGGVIGTFFLLQNRSSRGDANDLCRPECPESARGRIQELDARADRAATGAFISYGVGAAGLIAGGTLFYLSTKDDAPASGSRARPLTLAIVPAPYGALVHGTF